MNIFLYCKTNYNFKKFKKVISALTFIEKEQFTEANNDLNNFPAVIRPLYEYFFCTYICNNANICFPIKMRNNKRYFLIEVPKTNDGI